MGKNIPQLTQVILDIIDVMNAYNIKCGEVNKYLKHPVHLIERAIQKLRREENLLDDYINCEVYYLTNGTYLIQKKKKGGRLEMGAKGEMGTIQTEFAKIGFKVPEVPKEEGDLEKIDRTIVYQSSLQENKVRGHIKERTGFYKKEKPGKVVHKLMKGMEMKKSDEYKVAKKMLEKIAENSFKVKELVSIPYPVNDVDWGTKDEKRLRLRGILKKIQKKTGMIECSGNTSSTIWFLTPGVKLPDLLKKIEIMYGIKDPEPGETIKETPFGTIAEKPEKSLEKELTVTSNIREVLDYFKTNKITLTMTATITIDEK